MSILTELPTELILEVAEYLGDQDSSKIRLAVTCRRFYDALMPQILIDQVTHIQGLMLSPYAPRVHLYAKDSEGPKDAHGHVVISGSAFAAGPDPFRGSYHLIHYAVSGDEKNNRCVHGLISRAEQLDSATLDLRESCSLKKLASLLNACARHPNITVSIFGNGGRREDSGRGPFTYTFHQRGSHCYAQDNEVTAGAKGPLPQIFSSFFKSMSFVRRYFLPKETEEEPSTPQRNSVTYTAVIRQPKFPLSLVPEPQISSIYIRDDTLFLATLYPFTLDLLNLSPITKLHLSHITLHLFDWSQILPSLHMKALAHLSISDVQIACPDLLDFFQRHPTITSLDLTNHVPIGIVCLPPKPVLPLLSKFTANLDYLVPFLQHQLLGHFPELNELHAIATPSDPPPPTLRQQHRPKNPFHPVYDLLSQGTYNNLTLWVDTFAGSGLVEWALMKNFHQISSVSKLILRKEELRLPHGLYMELAMWDGFGALMKENSIDSDAQFIKSQVLERLVWYIFPKLKTLQLGVGLPERVTPLILIHEPGLRVPAVEVLT